MFKVDCFNFETNDLGKLIGIRVRHDNSGFYPSWFLDRIIITDKTDKYEFVCNKWFSTKRDDYKIDRIIREKNYEKFLEMSQKNKRQRKIVKKQIDENKNKEKTIEICNEFKYYYVKIYTGKSQAITGTDLKAEIKIFGDNFVSKIFKLNETKSHEIKFERNQVRFFL